MQMEGLRKRFEATKDVARNFNETYQSVRSDSNRSRSRPQLRTNERALNIEQLRRAQEHVAPVFVFLAKIIDAVEPVADRISAFIKAAWKALEPYHPEDLFVALYGFFLVFFGGVYMTLVATFEAAHLFGWHRIQTACQCLYTEWTKARAAFEHDNKVIVSTDKRSILRVHLQQARPEMY